MDLFTHTVQGTLDPVLDQADRTTAVSKQALLLEHEPPTMFLPS